MKADTIKLALREAFNAGAAQGRDEATSYEWGEEPDQSMNSAFAELFEEWSKEDNKAIWELLDDEG